MYIHRIILRDVRNFDNLDITLYDDVWQKPLNSVLIKGVNGSGKTTLLRVIATLWESFQWWLKLEEYGAISAYKSWYRLREISINMGLMAIEIRGFPQPVSHQNDTAKEFPEAIWLFIATDDDYMAQLPLEESPNRGFIGVKGTSESFKLETSLDISWVKNMNTQLQSLQIGVGTIPQLPNMLFFDTADRTILEPPDQSRFEAQPESLYKWFVGYSNRDRTSPHIETTIKNIKLRNPSTFDSILKSVNQFLGNTKYIADFDENLRLLVQVNKPKPVFHYIEDLSFGEQQCLIMMVMVSRWMMPGGIVLIDEPDLHLHESLQRHFIHELEKIIHSRNGQLIIASHSKEMRDEFYDSQHIDLGNLEKVAHD
ncbi:MAG: AAA family ATPase [bacterium]|nr:AAA family ATPase [bacterium]